MVLLVVGASALGTGLLVPAVLAQAGRAGLIDTPNARSAHTRPTPTGGGLAVMPVLLLCWCAVAWAMGDRFLLISAVAAAGLVALSLADDRRPLSPGPRLLAHGLCVAAGLAALPAQALVFQGLLPPLADRLVAGLAWLWFVNLFNFMDGIDGLAGSEAVVIAGGIALAGIGLALPAAAVMGASLGFLRFNWPPARLFLGDVGSVPLGFLLGALLLAAAVAGAWPLALILPAYFWADASLTLAGRALAGEPVWRAHNGHFYQKAARAYGGHRPVLVRVWALNGVMVALAAAQAWLGMPPLAAVALAAAATLALILWFWRRDQNTTP